MAEKMTEREQFYYGKGYVDGRIALLKEIKEETTDNKMAEVAAMFGKKLDEEFVILTPTGKLRKVKFTANRGLLYYDGIECEWNKNYGYLNFLCEGKAEIVEV